jgi:hypothetical protein
LRIVSSLITRSCFEQSNISNAMAKGAAMADFLPFADKELTHHIPGQVLERFAGRLVNRWDTYAVPVAGSRWTRVEDALSLARMEEHLFGFGSIGLYEHDGDGLARWGVMDTDNRAQTLLLYDVHVRGAEEGIPVLVETSRYGRAHGWLFLSEPIPSKQLRDALKILSLGKIREIFPKACSSTSFGNLMRCPGGIHPKTLEVYPFENQPDNSPSGFAEYIADAPTVTRGEILRLLNRREDLLVEQAIAEQQNTRIIEQLHARLNPVEVLGWFDARPTSYNEEAGKLVGHCPFHPDDEASLASWRSAAGHWYWCCHAVKCPTFVKTERGQRTYDLINLVAMKKQIDNKAAIGWLAAAFGLVQPGFKRILTPEAADGYSCRSFDKVGWPEVLPDIQNRGYRVLAEMERERSLPPFGQRTAKATVVTGASDDRPWLIVSYRQFARRLTGKMGAVATASRVLEALAARGLILIEKGQPRAKGARSLATLVLRVWPVPLPTQTDQLAASVMADFPGTVVMDARSGAR